MPGFERTPSEAPDLMAELTGFFDGARLRDKSNSASALLTVTRDGWPHAAMISVGELVVRSTGDVRLATWSRSRTTANIRRTGRALLQAVLGAHAIRARLGLVAADDDGRLTLFTGHLEELDEDVAAYATLLSGPTFRLHDPDDVLIRWEHTIERLQRL